MKTSPQHLFYQEFEAEKVLKRKQMFLLGPGKIIIAIVMLVILVTVSAPLTKKAWNSFEGYMSLPTLTFNPNDQVVKVTEADGTVLTMDSGRRFYQRVSEIEKKGRFQRNYTGRLDGRP